VSHYKDNSLYIPSQQVSAWDQHSDSLISYLHWDHPASQSLSDSVSYGKCEFFATNRKCGPCSRHPRDMNSKFTRSCWICVVGCLVFSQERVQQYGFRANSYHGTWAPQQACKQTHITILLARANTVHMHIHSNQPTLMYTQEPDMEIPTTPHSQSRLQTLINCYSSLWH
jgi:hypothetical protein